MTILRAHSKDLGQPGHLWVFAGCTGHFVVLTCFGSYQRNNSYYRYPGWSFDERPRNKYQSWRKTFFFSSKLEAQKAFKTTKWDLSLAAAHNLAFDRLSDSYQPTLQTQIKKKKLAWPFFKLFFSCFTAIWKLIAWLYAVSNQTKVSNVFLSFQLISTEYTKYTVFLSVIFLP